MYWNNQTMTICDTRVNFQRRRASRAGLEVGYFGVKTAQCAGLMLTSFGLFCSAACALVDRNQLALLHVELFLVNDFPLVKPAFTQGFALMFFAEFRLAEFDYFTHWYDTYSLYTGLLLQLGLEILKQLVSNITIK
jgi:hypothetical protein